MAGPVSSHPTADRSVDSTIDVDALPQGRAVAPAEQVEQRLQVTSPRMWLALVGFVVLIVVGLVWGILGRAADQVTGIGVMLPSEGLYDLSSPTPGIVRGISARNGDKLTAGETVLYLGLADGSVKEVSSAIDGTILALLVKLGSYIDAGSPVATIEPARFN